MSFEGLAPDRFAQETPSRAAIVETASGAILSYQDLTANSVAIAALLRERDLRPGDHVAAISENSAGLLELAWACQRAGFYYSFINTHLTPGETQAILENCRPKALFMSERHAARLADLAKGNAELLPLPLPLPLPYRPAGTIALPPAEETEGQWLLYSSGTSGPPKGVKRPLRGVPYGTPRPGEQVMGQQLQFGRKAIYLSIGPLYHMGPLSFAMGSLRLGGTVILMERFDAAEVLRLIETHRVTHLFAVPTYFKRLLDLPPPERARHDLSSLKIVLHSAAPCPIALKLQMLDWWGPIIFEFYGTTEGIGSCIISSQDWLAHLGSVGRPFGCDIAIVNAAGSELPPGKIGSVYMRSAEGFAYHDAPGLTASAHDAQGRATAGDLGYLDAEGYLYLTGRAGDMIITGGVNVAPEEAEAVLCSHPAIAECAVYGIPDADYGELVQAAVVLKADRSIAGADLIAYARAHLADFKCPRRILFLAELPRSETGKLLRRQLRNLADG